LSRSRPPSTARHAALDDSVPGGNRAGVQPTQLRAPAGSGTRAFAAELSGAATAVSSGALLAGAAWVNITLSGHLGLFFGVSFVLTAITAALVVDVSGMFTAGVLPPLLLLAVVTGVVLLSPDAVVAPHLADSAGTVQRVIGGIVDHAAALVLGHGGALTLIGLRIRASG